MRSLRKKVAALAAGAAIVAGPAIPAFASAYSVTGYTDVTASTSGANAIELLSAMGVLNGMSASSSGSVFDPSGTLTRAQFAKMVDLAMGLGSAAAVDTGSSNFSDVAAGQWYTGFVNIAAARGLINGFPDGTFQPNAQVTYGQAITIVVRALGYESTVTGPYPTGYIAEASQIQTGSGHVLGLLAGLSAASSSAAMPRSDAATLTANMLDSYSAQNTYTGSQSSVSVGVQQGGGQFIKNLGYGVNESGATLLQAPTVANANLVTAVPVVGDSNNQITVQSGSSFVTLTVASSVGISGAADLNGLFGKEISYVTNSSGQVIFIGVVNPSSNIITGATLGTAPSTVSYGSTVTLKLPGATSYGSYTVSSVGYEGNVTSAQDGDMVNVVLDANGHVISILDPAALTPTDVYLTGVANGQASFMDASGTKGVLPLADNVSVTLNGQASSAASLAAGDIVAVAKDHGGNISYIAASNQTVSGISNTYTSNGSTYATINGTSYGLSTNLLDLNGGNPTGGTSNNLGSNANVTAYVGPDGKIFAYQATGATSATGLVVNAVPGTVTVENSAGALATYPTSSTFTSGDIVQLSMSQTSGMATLGTDYTTSGAFGANATATMAATVIGVAGNEVVLQSSSASTIFAAYVGSGTPIWTFNGSGGWGAGDSASVGTRSDIAVGDLVGIATGSHGTVKGILVTGGTSSAQAAYNQVDALVTSATSPTTGLGTITAYGLGGDSLSLTASTSNSLAATIASKVYTPVGIGDVVAFHANEMVGTLAVSTPSMGAVIGSSPSVYSGQVTMGASTMTVGSTSIAFNAGTVFIAQSSGQVISSAQVGNSDSLSVASEAPNGTPIAEYVIDTSK